MACANTTVATFALTAAGEGEVYSALCFDPATTGLGIELNLVNETLVTGDQFNYGDDLNIFWLIFCGALVFLMQLGFALLEAGSVQKKNTVNILFKNLLDVSLGALCFYVLGYAFAYGDSAGGFIGTSNFAISDMEAKVDGSFVGGWEGWFFQFAFAATAATIVSGSVAERTKLGAYFVYSIFLTTFIYPVVVHWGWSGGGWLSAFNSDPRLLSGAAGESHGYIDFAGSGIVHMVGGFAGLIGAIAVGPRNGRFELKEDGTLGAPTPLPGHSVVLTVLGVVILWFGWYGFNCGSTLVILGASEIAGKAAVTTTLAPAVAAIVGAVASRFMYGYFDITTALNSVIAGLVSITAGCSTVEPWAACIIGAIGAMVYILSDKLLLKFKIDDPLAAAPLHGFCGFWGVIAVGIFSFDENIEFSAYPNGLLNTYGSGEQLGVQIIGALSIMAWTVATSSIVFFGMKYTIGLRVDADTEEVGLDVSEHGAASYTISK